MATSTQGGMRRGYGNEERPVTSVLWQRDSQAGDEVLQARGNYEPDNRNVDYRRYYAPEFMELETRNLWLKKWMLAGREEELPNVGDRMPFEIGRLSFMIVRSGEDSFHAFYNSCRHRGTKLCDRAGSGATIRCPYHGWEWKPDGSLARIPSHWDFTDINRKNGSLHGVRLERWGGFLFINADPEAPSLAVALGPIASHFEGFQPEKRYTYARFRKQLPANWKIVQEAFMEGYHVLATHPAGIDFYGDTQAQYEIFSANGSDIARSVTPSAVPSMHASSDATPLAAAQMYAQGLRDWLYPHAELPELDPQQDLRAQVADWLRGVLRDTFGHEAAVADTLVIDSVMYWMFPNCVLWLSESYPLVYQFLPHPSDPEQSILDIRMLLPVPRGEPRPPAAPAAEIGLSEKIADNAPGFGAFGFVYDEDAAMMPRVQQGVKHAPAGHAHSHLGVYQESIIQRWNELFDRDAYKPGDPA